MVFEGNEGPVSKRSFGQTADDKPREADKRPRRFGP